ncbi:MAG: 6-phosphogluconolactonase [Halothiobacillaceae bacterium]|nr:6-phosphogluconolactonase [Halothiobacillaceae bacterium]
MPHTQIELHAYLTPSQTLAGCAAFMATKLAQAIAQRGIARIALAGGNTPKALYDLLAAPPQANLIDWSQVEFYFGDERAVPQTHPDSNFALAQTHLFTPLGIAPTHRFPMISAPMQPLALEATRYQQLLKNWAPSAVPVFDFILNGMGDDGHFASLFPATPALAERARWVVANPVPQHHTERLTLTYPVFEAARTVCFLVTGAAKHPAFSALSQTEHASPTARLVQNRRTDWFVDEACQNGLTEGQQPQAVKAGGKHMRTSKNRYEHVRVQGAAQ